MATSTQTITKHTYNASWGSGTQYTSVSGDSGSWPDSVTFGADIASHPMAVAGTFQNFVVTVLGAHPDLTLTLEVNGVATGITVSISSAATQGSDLVHTAAVVATDSVRIHLSTTGSGASFDIAFGLEFAATTANESFYAIPAIWGFSSAQWQLGGALGNGTFMKNSGAVPSLSNTYSIASTAGTLTRLQITTYAGAPTTNTWTASLRLNGVTQDGTGGTVNTTCTLTGAGTTAHSTFSLPIAITDHVDVYVTNDFTSTFLPGLGVAVAFTATTPGEFMICGGNNSPFLNNTTGWTWNVSEQEVATETGSRAPVGPTTMTVDGLYVELSGAPGTGKSWTISLLKSAVVQALAVTIANAATSGTASGSGIPFVAPDTINLEVVPTNTPAGAQIHWGYAVHLTTTPPPAPSGTTYPVRRLRQTVHVSSTQLWQFFSMLQLDLEAGVGLTTGQGSDPQVMLSWSDDGGHTWSEERWVSAGKLGEYRRRAIWWRLGRSRDRVWRIVVSDPVAWRLLQLIVDADPGTS